jgi:hypothetical protein
MGVPTLYYRRAGLAGEADIECWALWLHRASFPPEVVSVFWTTSYGVMLDVRELVVRHRATLTSSDEWVLRAFGLSTSTVSQMDGILKCIDAMYAAFNEDELAYLGYRRHVECHPLQDGYEMRVSGACEERHRQHVRPPTQAARGGAG